MPQIIISDSKDVYFNLALEDYLLHEKNDDYLILWQSDNAVVCGKHQNICAELNYGYCKANNIKMARRLSGGGTVFHDTGNLNFSFIQNLKHGLSKAIDYRQFLEPVRKALSSINVYTSYSSRNDLLLNNKKISGNAQHIDQKRKRVLHHGTLLIQSNLKALGEALKSQGLFTGHSVKSVRSEVANVFETAGDQVKYVTEILSNYFIKEHNYEILSLDTPMYERVGNIRDSKYALFSWIVGYSPVYTAEKEILIDNVSMYLEYKVEQLIVKEIKISKMKNSELLFTDILNQFNHQFLSEELSKKFSAEFNLNNPYILF